MNLSKKQTLEETETTTTHKIVIGTICSILISIGTIGYISIFLSF